jgi:hypothetical protein
MPWGTQQWGQIPWGFTGTAPYLVEVPLSPNGNFLHVPMVWGSGSDGPTANIEQLTIGGLSAVVNNVIQSGFSGSITLNGSSGYTVSIVALADYWQADYTLPWSIQIDNGIEKVFTGEIIKYVTLPIPSPEKAVEGTFLTAIAFPLQFTNKCDVVKTTDENAIAQNMTLSVMILLRGIPLSTHLGSRVPLMPFDPNDVITRDLLAQEVYRAIGIGEPRAKVDPGIIASSSEHKAKLIVPYTIPMRQNWESLVLALAHESIDRGN